MTSELSQMLSNTQKRQNSLQKFDHGFEAQGDAVCERCRLKNKPCIRVKTGSKKCLHCVQCSLPCTKSDTAAAYNQPQEEQERNFETPHDEEKNLMEEPKKDRTERDKLKADLTDNSLKNTKPALEGTLENDLAIWNLPSPSSPPSIPVEENVENHDFQTFMYEGDWNPALFEPPC